MKPFNKSNWAVSQEIAKRVNIESTFDWSKGRLANYSYACGEVEDNTKWTLASVKGFARGILLALMP